MVESDKLQPFVNVQNLITSVSQTCRCCWMLLHSGSLGSRCYITTLSATSQRLRSPFRRFSPRQVSLFCRLANRSGAFARRVLCQTSMRTLVCHLSILIHPGLLWFIVAFHLCVSWIRLDCIKPFLPFCWACCYVGYILFYESYNKNKDCYEASTSE